MKSIIIFRKRLQGQWKLELLQCGDIHIMSLMIFILTSRNLQRLWTEESLNVTSLLPLAKPGIRLKKSGVLMGSQGVAYLWKMLICTTQESTSAQPSVSDRTQFMFSVVRLSGRVYSKRHWLPPSTDLNSHSTRPDPFLSDWLILSPC